jgi:predicted ester cyclase
MKKQLMILPLALILCFMVGCQDKAAMAELEEFRAQAQVEEQNKELVRRWFEEIDKGNADFARDNSAPEYAYYFPSGITEPMSLEQGIEQTKMFMKAIPDLVHDIEEIIAVGNKVFVRFNGYGTNTGDIEEMGISATGKTVEVSSIVIFSFENGKVVEERQEADMLGFMQQFGFVLKPKEK